MTKTIPLHESFLSIQGEGINTGRPTAFIRVVGCNLSCSYCDTGYRPEDDRKKIPCENYTMNEFLKRMEYLNAPYFCFTGGEPLMYADFLYEAVERHCELKDDDESWLTARMPRYTFETNGTMPIKVDLDWRMRHSVSMTMDIKPFVFEQYRKVYIDNLDSLNALDEVKIVITNKDEITLVEDIIQDFPLPDYILSPMHDGKNFVNANLVCDFVTSLKKDNVRVGIQTHKMLNQR